MSTLERERIARWMIANSLATGHGDTVDDLLSEATGHIAEMRARMAKLEEERDYARAELKMATATMARMVAK